jgi:hypothetical protein
MIALEIKVDTRSLMRRLNSMNKNLPIQFDVASHNFAIIAKDSIKRQFLIQQKLQSRAATASRFDVIRKSRFNYVVTIPQSAMFLDSMTPHYVALRPGRKIYGWAMRNYGAMRKSNRSHVYRGLNGRITYREGQRSALYVTPDPFIERGYNRIRSRLQTELRQAVKRAFEQV